MNTPTIVYVYSLPGYDYKIVKNQPFSSILMQMDARGQYYTQLMQGVPMMNPMWEWIHTLNGRMYATYLNTIYDITELQNHI